MHRRLAIGSVIAALAGALWACQPANKAPPAPAPVVAQAPSPPVQNATMICRNSQNGRKVACGTPNAVLVGVKPN